MTLPPWSVASPTTMILSGMVTHPRGGARILSGRGIQTVRIPGPQSCSDLHSDAVRAVLQVKITSIVIVLQNRLAVFDHGLDNILHQIRDLGGRDDTST